MVDCEVDEVVGRGHGGGGEGAHYFGGGVVAYQELGEGVGIGARGGSALVYCDGCGVACLFGGGEDAGVVVALGVGEGEDGGFEEGFELLFGLDEFVAELGGGVLSEEAVGD